MTAVQLSFDGFVVTYPRAFSRKKRAATRHHHRNFQRWLYCMRQRPSCKEFFFTVQMTTVEVYNLVCVSCKTYITICWEIVKRVSFFFVYLTQSAFKFGFTCQLIESMNGGVINPDERTVLIFEIRELSRCYQESSDGPNSISYKNLISATLLFDTLPVYSPSYVCR